MGKHNHRWAFDGSEDEARECVACGTKRRNKNNQLIYQQWWGGWHPGCPPCSTKEERKRFWKEEDCAPARARIIQKALDAREPIQKCLDELSEHRDKIARNEMNLEELDDAVYEMSRRINKMIKAFNTLSEAVQKEKSETK